MKTQSIQITPEFKRALCLMEKTTHHLFITGKAGSGKSTLLQLFKAHTAKNLVVLAPTGVAAVNVAGQTIHSFFKFGIDIRPEKVRRCSNPLQAEIIRQLDTILIDEVSMVRADLLDCVDRSLRLTCKSSLPFAGKQMVFFGDLFQLPPVIPPEEQLYFDHHYENGYFFSAKALRGGNLKLIELQEIHRQKEPDFISLLNHIRMNSLSESDLRRLNGRYRPDFRAGPRDLHVTLTTRNQQARLFNHQQLQILPETEIPFPCRVEGDFYQNSFPADEILRLKTGARVMFLNNDRENRWINGTLGQISRLEPERDRIRVTIPRQREEVKVSPHHWDLIHYYYDIERHRIGTEVTGSFTQFPLRLAWAVTIHKSQGKTFDQVIIDIGRGTFSSGQLYVALSRCTTLEGIILKEKIRKKDIFLDPRILDFLNSFQSVSRRS